MSLLTRVVLAAFLATSLASQTLAQDKVSPGVVRQGLVAFNSDEGMARLARAAAKADFPALANQFEAQSNAAFCGPTTVAIVLNALSGRSRDLPRDRSRLQTEDYQYLPDGFDPTVPRFTQENVMSKGQKTRSEVLGAPITLNGKQIKDFGYQVRQLDQLLRAHDLITKLAVVDDTKPNNEIRTELEDNLKHAGDYAIVTYKRADVGQKGGGHISPLGAYDAESDSFLVLDVNPSSEGWVWMPTAKLIKGMRTFDTVENRGYILVQAR